MSFLLIIRNRLFTIGKKGINMITTFILLGGFYFWVSILAALGFGIFLVEKENGFAATIALLLELGILVLFSDVPIFVWIAANQMLLIYCLIGYFIIGIMWAIAKWYFYVLDRRDEALIIKEDHPSLNREDLIRKITTSTRYNDLSFPPNAKEHKADFLRWSSYWPLSITWSLLNDIISRIWTTIYSYITGILQKISNKIFKEI